MDQTEASAEEALNLPELPGLDTESGLARVGGKVSVYRKILQQFASGQADAPARIRSALQGHDLTTAEREAHTLKGVAGNIGAGEVEAAAKHVETAIKHGVDTEAPIAELERTLVELVGSLTFLMADVPSATRAASPGGQAPNLLPALDRLQVLLEESDSEAGDLVEEIEAQVTDTEFAQPMRAIGERIDDFEFEEALERLNALREVMSASTTDSTTLT
jgi:HPt (histidine-containing phosphotransfer) domain-containing protein